MFILQVVLFRFLECSLDSPRKFGEDERNEAIFDFTKEGGRIFPPPRPRPAVLRVKLCKMKVDGSSQHSSFRE